MPRVAKNPGSRPGRRTKEEELREYVTATGGDLAQLKEFLGGSLPDAEGGIGEAPEKFVDWIPHLRKLLWENAHTFDGIAAINAYKLIRDLANEERAGPVDEESDDRRPLLDRLEALPPDHAAQLVKAELERTDLYRADLFSALERLGAK